MRSMSTFGAFTVARMGIYAAQKGLEVTGNNISNINTRGYTRRVLDQISFSTGGKDRYQSIYDANTGGGVLCTGVSQLRDPYLDIRYREENSKVGSADAKLGALDALSGVLDEVAKGDGNGVVEKQFNDLFEMLNHLNDNVGSDANDTLVRSSAESLVELLHSYAQSLETVRDNHDSAIKEDVKAVNSILTRIRDLNDSIRRNEIYGDKALDLRDERNLLIDELSGYMKIDVTYKDEDIGAGVTVERMIISLGGNGQNNDTEKTVLVDGPYAREFSFREPAASGDSDKPYLDAISGLPTDDRAAAKLVASEDYGLALGKMTDGKGREQAGTQEVALRDNDLYGSIQATRDMLTQAGEFSVVGGNTSVRGIPYYQKALDSLANKVAEVFNKANGVNDAGTIVYKADKDGNYLDENGDILKDVGGNDLNKNNNLSATQLERLKEKGVKVGGALFTNGSAEDGTGKITAANIAISHGWASGKVRIVCDWDSEANGGPSQANKNIAHLIAEFDADHKYIPSDVADGASGESFFEGSFQEMLLGISSTLGKDRNVTSTLLTNYAVNATTRDVDRDSVAGVDLNDEAANLMTYQKSYAAACRLMTTLDEALDKLINGTGVVGR